LLCLLELAAARQISAVGHPGTSEPCAVRYFLTLVDTSVAGRAYAAYGGIYIVASLFWLWSIEGVRPDRWDVAGAAMCILGAAVIPSGTT